MRPEAVPSINYIGRQLDVSYIGRQMYGEISIYQIEIYHETSSGQHIVPQSTWTTRPLSLERTGSEDKIQSLADKIHALGDKLQISNHKLKG